MRAWLCCTIAYVTNPLCLACSLNCSLEMSNVGCKVSRIVWRTQFTTGNFYLFGNDMRRHLDCSRNQDVKRISRDANLHCNVANELVWRTCRDLAATSWWAIPRPCVSFHNIATRVMNFDLGSCPQFDDPRLAKLPQTSSLVQALALVNRLGITFSQILVLKALAT